MAVEKVLKSCADMIERTEGSRLNILDTCQGDSGGPIMYYSEMDRVWVLAGLTSYGRGCGLSDYAGVYTRASSYINWIESVIGSGNFMTIQQTTSGSSVAKQSFSATFIVTVLVPMFMRVLRFL